MNAPNKRPDFIIIGAMKCATSTLHEQLALVKGVSMSSPKEPNFFSDDGQYEKGFEWYDQIFNDDGASILGESSTHYTKFPIYPKTIDRMLEAGLTDTKFIYIIRHPIDRLISHYIHEWSQGVIKADIDSAVERHSELISYSLYHYQINHYLSNYSSNQIMLVFYDSLISRPQFEFERISDFIGIKDTVEWDFTMEKKNVSSKRIKRFPLDEFLVNSNFATAIRRACVPIGVRDWMKSRLTMNRRPALSEATSVLVTKKFDEDLNQLGALFGVNLSVNNFKETAMKNVLEWK